MGDNKQIMMLREIAVIDIKPFTPTSDDDIERLAMAYPEQADNIRKHRFMNI